MKYVVTLTRPDGYVFRNAFATIEEARAFMASATRVLLPGESLSFVVF